MIDQPFRKDISAALPVDVAASAGQEARHGVPSQVMDPPLLAELPHQCVNPREAGPAELPALEPRFRQRRVDGVFARCQTGTGRDFTRKVPGDETAIWIAHHLGERMPKSCLGPKIHVSEEKLSDQIGRYGRRLGFLVRINDSSGTMVEFAAGERAKVEMRGKKSGGLRGEGGWGGVGFGEGRSVCFIGNDFVKLCQSNRLAASMSCRRRLETQLRYFRDRKIIIRA